MEMMSESSRHKLLEKVLASKEFCNSSVYGNYLSYLLDAAFENKNLKETTIAIDFFEKDGNFNPAEDTIVRSHTYNLRKKLDSYYLTEGKDEKYRIRIPKGHYHLEIIPFSQNKYAINNIFQSAARHYQWLIIGLLLISMIVILKSNLTLRGELEQYHFVDKDDFIWKEFLQSELPVLIVPGDHFIYSTISNEFQREIYIRDFTINSKEDLDKLQEAKNDYSIKRAPEPYFPYHSIWSLPPIFLTLYSNHQIPILRKSSSIIPQMLDEYNIIFIGSIKTLYALRHTISKSNFDFSIAPHRVFYTDPDSNIVKEYRTNLHSTGPNEDLVLCLKLPGPVNNSILIIASYHSLGAPEIARYLTDEEGRNSLKELFQSKFNQLPRYFELLFRVVGIDKTAYNTEILVSHPLSE